MYFLDPPLKLELHESIGVRILGLSCSSIVSVAHYSYPNFKNKSINFLQMQNYFDQPFGFW